MPQQRRLQNNASVGGGGYRSCVPDRNCGDAISKPSRISELVIYAYYTSSSVYMPGSDQEVEGGGMSPNESLKRPDRTALVKGSSRVLIC